MDRVRRATSPITLVTPHRANSHRLAPSILTSLNLDEGILASRVIATGPIVESFSLPHPRSPVVSYVRLRTVDTGQRYWQRQRCQLWAEWRSASNAAHATEGKSWHSGMGQNHTLCASRRVWVELHLCGGREGVGTRCSTSSYKSAGDNPRPAGSARVIGLRQRRRRRLVSAGQAPLRSPLALYRATPTRCRMEIEGASRDRTEQIGPDVAVDFSR